MTALPSGARLAVLGSPIAHSKSPDLHLAAYRALGLDWSYERLEATAATLPGLLARLEPEWRGLSLTMPLKQAVLPLVPRHEPLVDRLGLANTLLLGPEARLYNTDVGGVLGALGALGGAGVAGADRAVVLGGGATAASALEALRLLGVTERLVAARAPERVIPAAQRLATRILPLTEVRGALGTADLAISTLPGHAAVAVPLPDAVTAPLLDVAYDPWPTVLGAAWQAAGGTLVRGLDMLLEQAVLQVRIFVLGSPDEPVLDEIAVRAAMRRAVEG